jgi:hypothetical protein
MPYAYAELETAVAFAVGAGPVHQRGSLRGRLKHFQKLGLPDLKTGKGRQIPYTYEHAAQWVIALLLAQTGLDPVVIVASIKAHWRQLASSIEAVTGVEAGSGYPYYLCIWPRVMSAAWDHQSPRPLTMQIMQFRTPFSVRPQEYELMRLLEGHPDAILTTVNLTRALVRLQTALPSRP